MQHFKAKNGLAMLVSKSGLQGGLRFFDDFQIYRSGLRVNFGDHLGDRYGNRVSLLESMAPTVVVSKSILETTLEPGTAAQIPRWSSLPVTRNRSETSVWAFPNGNRVGIERPITRQS